MLTHHASNVFAEPSPKLVKQFGSNKAGGGGTVTANKATTGLGTEDGRGTLSTEDGNIIETEN